MAAAVATHYHIHEGMDLTLCTLNDADIHLAGAVADAKLPEVDGTTVSYTTGDFGEDIIIVDHPETQTFKFVKVACADDTCAVRYADYWL